MNRNLKKKCTLRFHEFFPRISRMQVIYIIKSYLHPKLCLYDINYLHPRHSRKKFVKTQSTIFFQISVHFLRFFTLWTLQIQFLMQKRHHDLISYRFKFQIASKSRLQSGRFIISQTSYLAIQEWLS